MGSLLSDIESRPLPLENLCRGRLFPKSQECLQVEGALAG